MSFISSAFNKIYFALWITVFCCGLTTGCSYETSFHGSTSNGIGQFNKQVSLDLLAIRKKAQIAYASGLDKIMQDPELTVGEVWVLQEILRIDPSETLRKFIATTTEKLADDPFLRLIAPDTPPYELPADPGTGTARFKAYLLAPFGRPETRAISFIRDFVSTTESGYTLTHQVLVLHWGEQAGLTLPRQLACRKQQLLDQILKEQLNDFSFSDLFTERVVLLLSFTTPGSKNVIQWVKTIIDAQLPDGSWGNYSAQLSYDGQSVTGKIGASHTIALALQTLRIFLNIPETCLGKELITPKNKCLNLNHRRTNALVRFCPMCGELMNKNIPMSGKCSTASHAKKRREINKYCFDCGEQLIKQA